ncbi:MAG: hypothetical protein QOC94_2285, partial [Actinoplanes sp.]|nr:hypothetical protein [Actinoplanes sp.]
MTAGGVLTGEVSFAALGTTAMLVTADSAGV